MPECQEESETQHYLAGHGFGPVQNAEYVYFAVFEKTKRDGVRLAANSFDNKHLKKDGQSVCRASFITMTTFAEYVVRGGTNPKGALTGVSAALVGAIRTLQSKVILNSSERQVRLFCVLDHVLPGDYDSHATMSYGEGTSQGGLSESQINKIRSKARLDLADVFGPIVGQNELPFAPDAPTKPSADPAA